MSNPTPESDEPRMSAQHIYLIVAIVTGAVTVAVWLVDMALPGDVPRGIYDALRVLIILSGCGYLVRSAETRVRHAVGRAYLEGYADGFTDGAASPSPRPLRSIH